MENLSWDVEFDDDAKRDGLVSVAVSFHRAGSTEALPLVTGAVVAQIFVRRGTPPEDKAAQIVSRLRQLLGDVLDITYNEGDDDFQMKVKAAPGEPVPDAIAIAGASKVDGNTDEDITIVKDAPGRKAPPKLTGYLLLEGVGEGPRCSVELRLGALHPSIVVEAAHKDAAHIVDELVQGFNEQYVPLGYVAQPWFLGPAVALDEAAGLSIENVPCPLGLAAGVRGTGLTTEMGLVTLPGPRFDLGEPTFTQDPVPRGGKGAKAGKNGKDKDRDEEELPPVIHGEEFGAACDARFVNGILANECDPRAIEIPRACSGEIAWFLFPGSRWAAGAAGGALAVAELNRTIEYYAHYCLRLNARRLQFDAADMRKLERWYADWFGRVSQAIGGAGNFGRTTIPSALNREFLGAMADLQKAAQQFGTKLLVVFIDEYITDHRPTPVSACRRGFQQIGINWVDRGSPYILAHELVHALGKPRPNRPGAVTWDHKSPCQNALTTIARTDSRTPIDLSNRLLEVAEFREIVDNRGGGVLRCRAA